MYASSRGASADCGVSGCQPGVQTSQGAASAVESQTYEINMDPDAGS